LKNIPSDVKNVWVSKSSDDQRGANQGGVDESDGSDLQVQPVDRHRGGRHFRRKCLRNIPSDVKSVWFSKSLDDQRGANQGEVDESDGSDLQVQSVDTHRGGRYFRRKCLRNIPSDVKKTYGFQNLRMTNAGQIKAGSMGCKGCICEYIKNIFNDVKNVWFAKVLGENLMFSNFNFSIEE
jgi:hypothetical protein